MSVPWDGTTGEFGYTSDAGPIVWPTLFLVPDNRFDKLTVTYSMTLERRYGACIWSYDSHPGDLNRDGFVNSADLDIVREHWNETVTAGDLAMGDATGDGFVGSGDLDTVRANWGESLFAAAVPEPGVLSLLAMGLFCLAGRARRS